jgi:uncharacterized protein YlxW (UPF0749 family)
MGLRARVGGIVIGSSRTDAALAAYGAELRDLQQKVEALTAVVVRLEASLASTHADERARTDAQMSAMREQLRVVVDDLGDRVGALTERLGAGAHS